MPKNPSNYSEIRIIGGSLRSRKIVFPVVNELRPTPNRVRETLFNWLAPYIRGARCLDMFAGSGALGFEAISRGASYCLMLDSSDEIIAALIQNQITLKVENIAIQKATFPFTAQTITKQFDIIFLDPPFHKDYIGRASTWLKEFNCLREDALIYIESENEQDALPIPKDWTRLKEKTAGNVRYSLFQSERI